MQKFRNNGAIGALLDEYERALQDLKKAIAFVSDDDLSRIVDGDTQDEDCRSIQTILTHVVRSGYCYAVFIRNMQGEQLAFPQRVTLDTAKAYQLALDKMFAFNVQVFEDYPDIQIETKEISEKIKTPWGQTYDVEQLLEHAIVHILRHRRQIERFLAKII